MEPALGAVAGLGRWFVGCVVLLNAAGVFLHTWRCCFRIQRTESCQCESGQPWAYHGPVQGQIQLLKKCAAAVVELELSAVAGWFAGGAFLLNAGDFQVWRRCSATTTAHRALPVCEWPAWGLSWGTARKQHAACVSCVGVVEPALVAAGGVVRGLCRCRGAARQPQRTEPCQCGGGQSWACHGPLQNQI